MFPEMASMISRTGSKANSVNKKKSRPSGSFLLIFLTLDTDAPNIFLTVFASSAFPLATLVSLCYHNASVEG